MDVRASPRPFFPRPRSGHAHPWLGAILKALDRRLRVREGVHEYSACPECILRIQIVDSRENVILSDGTRVRPGDRLIDLHFWSEQIPSIPRHGATLAWAKQMNLALDLSLRELARYLAERRDLDDVSVIRANMTWGAHERRDQVARFCARYQFEWVPSSRARSLGQRLHRFGENILISLLVIACNAAAFRAESLRRDRVPVYLSRRKLAQRFKENREFVNARSLQGEL